MIDVRVLMLNLSALLCVMCLMCGVAYAEHQSTQQEDNKARIVLDSVEMKGAGESSVIDVHFRLPLEYVKHFPRDVGEILQIQLRTEDTEPQNTHKEVREGSELFPKEGQQSLLVYVTYEEGVPGGPFLTLRFAHPVRFEVHPGTDRLSLSIDVHDEAVAEVSSAANQANVDKSVDLMMAKARQAITFGNNSGAIDLLRRILRMPENAHTQDANELLGLAYERDNQIPRATFEYKKYLKRYPEGDGASRVQQRLAALRELRLQPKRHLREATQSRKPDQFIAFGRLSQFYSEYYIDQELQGEAEAEEQTLKQKILSTYLSSNLRYRSEERVVQAELGVSNLRDYLAGKEGREDDKKSETEIKRLYVDVDDKVYGYAARVGRQSSRNGGVFGTFDGVVAGIPVAPRWRISGLAGKPVLHHYSDADLPDKSFIGIKADVESENREITSDMFFMRQKADGLIDREAVGADVRYAKQNLSVFGLLDYDAFYHSLSLFNVRLGWNYTKANKLNLSYNRRHLLFTSNVLGSGQAAETLKDLLDSGQWTERDIYDAAEKRTRLDETLTVGNTYQINKDRQVSVDVTVLRSRAVPNLVDPVKLANATTPQEEADAVIWGSDATGNQFLYSLQWISSNTFIERDLYMFGLRRSDFDSYRDTSLYLNARVPLFVKWRPGFRLGVSRRESESYGERLALSPTINVDYHAGKTISFEGELGYEFIKNRDKDIPNEVHKSLRLGYNYTF